MRIYIFNSNNDSLNNLMTMLRGCVLNSRIEGFTDKSTLLQAVMKDPADVYFIHSESAAHDGLETVRQIEKSYGHSNIIITSSNRDCMEGAMELHASDYIVEPITPEKVTQALENIRYQIVERRPKIRAITFGNFTLYVDNKPVDFHRPKSVELLAYLVAAKGAVVNRKELTLELFGDETHSRSSQKNLYNFTYNLVTILKQVGAEGLVIRQRSGLAVDTTMFTCDLYDFINGETNLYQGSYMEGYTWGENFKGFHC